MTKFKLEILALDKKLFSGEVSSVSVPTLQGTIQILSQHEPLITPLIEGELKYEIDNKTEYIATGGGFVEITADRATVFSESAERAADIDEAKAEEAMGRAKKIMEGSKDKKIRFDQAAAEYRRMLMQLRVAKRYKKKRN